MEIAFLMLSVLSLLLFPNSICKSFAARPPVVNIGSILQLNSTTGGVSAVAIHAALDDINSDPTVLNGTTLNVEMKDASCLDGFLGMVQGRPTVKALIHFALLKLFLLLFWIHFCVVKIVFASVLEL